MERRLKSLGAHVAESLDETRERSGSSSRVRAKLVAGEPLRANRKTAAPVRIRPRTWAGALAIAASIALAIGFAHPHAEHALTFTVAGEQPTVVAELLAAPPAAPMPIAFSDGTSLRLAPAARARVAEVTPHGARVLLEKGDVHAEVKHLPGAKWSVEAGPFDVRVTGTKFDVSWDPAAEAVVVSLEEGSVVVTGCTLGEGRRVTAGERLVASCKEPPRPVATEALAAPAVSASQLPDAPSPTSPTPIAKPAPDPTEPILALARRGAHAEAIGAAEANGFDATCNAASAQGLLLLADSARYAGRFDRATEALATARRRFPRSDAAATAAFELGRIAFDVRKDYAAAGDAFESYLRERPSGSLAREALGRALEARSKAGDARAETLATRYLSTYPDGPHAKLARRIAVESTP